MPTCSSESALSLRAECIRGYEWPSQLKGILEEELRSFRFDRSALEAAAAGCGEGELFVLTTLSEELLELGVFWIRCALDAGVESFAVAGVDRETTRVLHALGIPHVPVELPPRLVGMTQLRNPGGFDAKAIALIACRLQMVCFLLERGVNVLACDVDALVMANPRELLGRGVDIAFQRVVYFPAALARLWGFTACAGCVLYRAAPGVVSFANRVLGVQREASSDQIALNLALWDEGVEWILPGESPKRSADLEGAFSALAAKSVRGHLRASGLTVEALSATKVWRHHFVPLDRSRNFVLHPNSPKDVAGKTRVFEQLLSSKERQRLAEDRRLAAQILRRERGRVNFPNKVAEEAGALDD